MHDHPARFVSIGVKGRYIEETQGVERIFTAPWIRTFPASHIHRIRLCASQEAWTIVIIFPHVREFGFWRKGVWTHWQKYFAENKCDK
jgi:hypothetical protein